MAKIINIKKKNLKENGYRDLEHWLETENHMYIGRNMSFYVKGATKSKWANPYSAKKYGREKCLELFKKYILNTPSLYEALPELSGKVLGCWCKPERCHGDIIIELLGNHVLTNSKPKDTRK